MKKRFREEPLPPSDVGRKRILDWLNYAEFSASSIPLEALAERPSPEPRVLFPMKRFSTIMRTFFSLLIGFALAISLAGCDSNGGGEAPTAQVRFMHASADAGPVDVLVDGETVASGVSFSGLNNGISANPTVSSYLEVPVASGTSIGVQDAGGNTVFTTSAGDINLQENAQYTVIVAGAVAAGENTPQPIVLRDRFETELADDEVGLRLVHGAAGAGPVDVYLTPPDTDLQNVEPIASNFEFTQDFPGGFAGQFAPQAVSQDGSDLSVTPAGAKTPVLLELRVGGDQGLTVSPGQFITGVAIDGPDGGAGALVQVDVPGQAAQ